MISGAIYPGVPHRGLFVDASSILTANPKSDITISNKESFFLNRMFSGLISLWTNP